MQGFKVLQVGSLSLVQDKGRLGYNQYGVSQSGCADLYAYSHCNHLLSNHDNAAVIEITLGALLLEAQTNTCIAVCGADLEFTLNNKTAPLWQTINIKMGDTLRWNKKISGVRCYLAVKNGFTIAQTLGSVATNMREKMGGLRGDGEPLKQGDIIPYETTDHQTIKALNPQYIPTYPKRVSLNIMPAYQFYRFTKNYRKHFLQTCFTISNKIDRVGYRLQGDALSHTIKLPYSEGMVIGAVQIPPNGSPIIMLNDAPSIGGYPKIGSITAIALNKLAQSYSGDEIVFKLV